MNQKTEKKFAGVWIDNDHAIIITPNQATSGSDFAISGKVEAEATHGGGSEHSINNARQAHSLKYFKSISSLLLNYDEIFIIGPGKSQEQLKNHLQDDAHFKNKKVSIGSADHLTDPQMIAKVRDHFSGVTL